MRNHNLEALLEQLAAILEWPQEPEGPTVAELQATLELLRRYILRYHRLSYDVALQAHDLTGLAAEIRLALEHIALTDGVERLRRNIPHLSNRLTAGLNALQSRAKTERDLIQGKQDLKAIEQNEQLNEVFDLRPILQQARQKWVSAWLSLNVPAQPVLICAQRRTVALMVDEVIRNGIKYGANGEEGCRIELHLKQTADESILQVISPGRPLSQEEKKRSTETSQSIGQGTGRGLAFVRRMMREYFAGQADWEHNQPRAEGNCFEFRFPHPAKLGQEEALASPMERSIMVERIKPFPIHYELLSPLTSEPAVFLAVSDDGPHWIRYAYHDDLIAMDKLHKEYHLLSACEENPHPALPLTDGFFDAVIENNLARYLLLQTDPATPVLLSQLLDSRSLDRGKGTIISIAGQMAGLLSYLHTSKLLARSLSPDRFYVAESNEGQFTLQMLKCDGLVFYSDRFVYKQQARPGWDLNSAHHPLGDPRYLSPEHQGGATPDLRSDVYAFGALLYRVIWDQPPLTPLTAVPPLPADLSDLTDLADLVVRCLHPRPARRPEDGTRLQRALQPILERLRH